MDEIRDDLEVLREKLQDYSLELLKDAIYRNDSNAKTLERQCAKISRAIDKAMHEYDVLNSMKSLNTED